MKAVVYYKYGPPEVLEIRELPKPVPKAGEVLVKVYATTVAAGDWRMRRPSPMAARLYNGLLRPKRVNVLGFELAGKVEATGPGVERFKIGDDVFAFTGFGFGAHAEYKCLAESGKIEKVGAIELMPTSLTHEEAAALPVGGLTALGFLRKAALERGEELLVYGASGSVGTYAVQLGKYRGAKVTGVSSAANAALVRSLGADETVDYTLEDFAMRGRSYDVVFDAVGKLPRSQGRKALKQDGRFVSVRSSAKLEPGDLRELRETVEAGGLRPIVDRRYPLSEIVAAHTYVEHGHKKGNVVITVAGAA